VDILTAKRYPAINRTVVRVVVNPDDARWVHSVLDSDGNPTDATTTAPSNHTGDPTDDPGTACSLCHLNWQIEEVVFDGPEMSDDALKAGAKAIVEGRLGASATTLSSLAGVTL
jgi:hypothetical protein